MPGAPLVSQPERRDISTLYAQPSPLIIIDETQPIATININDAPPLRNPQESPQ